MNKLVRMTSIKEWSERVPALATYSRNPKAPEALTKKETVSIFREARKLFNFSAGDNKMSGSIPLFCTLAPDYPVSPGKARIGAKVFYDYRKDIGGFWYFNPQNAPGELFIELYNVPPGRFYIFNYHIDTFSKDQNIEFGGLVYGYSKYKPPSSTTDKWGNITLQNSRVSPKGVVSMCFLNNAREEEPWLTVRLQNLNNEVPWFFYKVDIYTTI